MENEDDSSVSTPWLLSMLNVYHRTQVKNEDDSSVATPWLLSNSNVIRELKGRMIVTVQWQLVDLSQI